ncbi:MAG TPA: hypothetical protein VE973_03230 [Candidatus Limnocylindria bacterium]|nr:hypothetical protein [Candidatus Limnocylindria bacterium]
MDTQIICFGQQPCGFFPKKFLVAKINTARQLQKEIGGKLVFFYHDSDADYRETITLMRDVTTGADVRLNFLQENKIQKKFSPLYAKKIPQGWQEEILKQLPRFAGLDLINTFKSVMEFNVADFCLEMYKKMGLLDGIEIFRSGNKNFRESASELEGEYFADVEYQTEIVRAEMFNGKLRLHEGGGKYLEIPTAPKIHKWQKNPGKDARFGWMNSVINCTHYIAGNSEYEYLNKEVFGQVKFIKREDIVDQNYAWLGN